MKYTFFLIVLAVFSCETLEKKEVSKTWLDRPVNFTRITETLNNYHMFDSTGTKVGSMDFAWSFQNEKLISRDTSQFDDGSVYETGVFEFDTSEFHISKVAIDMKVGPTTIDIDLSHKDGRIKGTSRISRDTFIREFTVDSIYGQHVFREELYMLMHTIDYEQGDSIALDVFVPSSLHNSKASIAYIGHEKIEVPAGKFDCTVIMLRSDGNMPANKIWIRNEEPKKIVKFYVPGPELTIELVKEI